jgi:hypothetical protein
VRKLFRDKTTGAFLTGSGEWTLDPELALDFIGNSSTDIHWRARGLRDVEWLYLFENPRYDFTIQISPLVPGMRTPSPDASA